MSDTSAVRDVLIVGGGPAGLSAALLLGRCRRSVLLCDADEPRNRFTSHVHGFLSRDPVSPRSLRAIARRQLRPYDVTIVTDAVRSVHRRGQGFEARLASGAHARARKVLVATGVEGHLPEIAGFMELYGRSVYHCPYCDGWELRDEPLAALGAGSAGVTLAHELLGWSEDVVLLTNGRSLSARERAKLAGIPADTGRIERLAGRRGHLERIVFEDGRTLERRGLFFIQDVVAPAALERLGATDDEGRVEAGELNRTAVDGIWVAGDAKRDVRFAIVAAAEGAKAAYAINEALLGEERRARVGRRAA